MAQHTLGGCTCVTCVAVLEKSGYIEFVAPPPPLVMILGRGRRYVLASRVAKIVAMLVLLLST